MIILHPFPPLTFLTPIICYKPSSPHNHFFPSSTLPLLFPSYATTSTFSCTAASRRRNLNGKDFDIDIVKEDPQELEDGDGNGGFSAREVYSRREGKDIDIEEVQEGEGEDEDEVEDDIGGGYSGRGPYAGREEKDYDRDPEFAEILGSCFDDPQKAQSKIEERIRKKRTKILHTKTGSGVPMKVSVDKFDFSNSYIWLEFFNAPLAKDISLICDTIRAWHIVGRLGGCNSMNMQLSQSPMDKRPSYDFIQGANVTPTTFYNIGDLEVQDNLARLWVDIGTCEPLLLDVLINALTQISSDFVGIKQVKFGGEFENWKENMTTEDSGFSVHKI